MSEATPDQIRQITHNVLARPEFQPAQPDWNQIVLRHIFDWFRAITKWSAENPSMAKGLIVLLTILLLILLGHVAYTAVREFGSLRKSGGYAPRRSAGALEGIADDWEEALRVARAALTAGNIYKALWVIHRTLLSVLDGRGDIKFVRWKTNKDYLLECRDATAGRELLVETTRAYERVIYGHWEFEPLEVEKVLVQVETLAAQAGR